MKALQKMLTERPVDEVKLLLRWFLLASRASELGRPWRLQEEAFTTERKGLKNPPQLERVVTQQIGAQLYHPLSQLYVQTYFPESTRRDIIEMVGHIKDEFATRLRSNPWLDEATRSAALEKLGKIDIQVGYPTGVGRFQRAGHSPGRPFRQRAARQPFRVSARHGAGRQARAQQPFCRGDQDHADRGELRLQLHHQHHRHHGGHPAAAVLPAGRRCRRQLLRHRRR